MQVRLDITPWMVSWGWHKLPDLTWEKRSPSGLIIAQQGGDAWHSDCQRAFEIEEQLLETPKQ